MTRARLAEWGFTQMPAVWLLSPLEGRHTYFERWYHSAWNYTAIIGWPGKDPLVLTEDDFLASLQGHILSGEEAAEQVPWDDTYCGL